MTHRTIDAARRHAGSMFVEGFFQGMSRLGRLHPHARPERHGVEVTRDVPYATTGHPDHRLDVYRPTRVRGPRPVVVYLHGGGFRLLSKDTHWLMALAFARRGYLVFNVSYRLAPTHPYPAAVEDAATALSWALDHAREWGGDPSRVVLAGESAGANLVAALTVACTYEREEPFARRLFERELVPKAVLPACGIFQVSDTQRFARRREDLPRFLVDRLEEVEHGYLGRTPRTSPGLDLADPLCVFERGAAPQRPLPPFFLPVGTKDPLLDDTRRLDAALRRLGATSEARYYAGEIHAFHAMIFRANARSCWEHTFDFLDRHCPAGG